MWVDSGGGVPIGAQVKVTPTGQLQLIDDEGKVENPYRTLLTSGSVNEWKPSI